MKIINNIENNTSTIELIGSLDTMTSKNLENEINDLPNNIINIDIDLNELEFISSAGLRSIIIAHKRCINLGGKLVIKNITDDVMQVFDMSGFSNHLNIE